MVVLVATHADLADVPRAFSGDFSYDKERALLKEVRNRSGVKPQHDDNYYYYYAVVSYSSRSVSLSKHVLLYFRFGNDMQFSDKLFVMDAGASNSKDMKLLRSHLQELRTNIISVSTATSSASSASFTSSSASSSTSVSSPSSSASSVSSSTSVSSPSSPSSSASSSASVSSPSSSASLSRPF